MLGLTQLNCWFRKQTHGLFTLALLLNMDVHRLLKRSFKLLYLLPCCDHGGLFQPAHVVLDDRAFGECFCDCLERRYFCLRSEASIELFKSGATLLIKSLAKLSFIFLCFTKLIKDAGGRWHVK